MICCVDTDCDNQIVRIACAGGLCILITMVYMYCYSTMHSNTKFFEKNFSQRCVLQASTDSQNPDALLSETLLIVWSVDSRQAESPTVFITLGVNM